MSVRLQEDGEREPGASAPNSRRPDGGNRTHGRVSRNSTQQDASSSLHTRNSAHPPGTDVRTGTGATYGGLRAPLQAARQGRLLTATSQAPKGRGGPALFPRCFAAEHAQRSAAARRGSDSLGGRGRRRRMGPEAGEGRGEPAGLRGP